ncbi:single-stranded DNA-binding protein [Streptomyces lavendulae]|uniref:Single-stranded DNA-binding protein 1 n=1 Tax=Streptomyces lavendulae subsp. lavendulae TaxID=58340 RepID=A0A2K8PIS3_STRLA|nr:single-stranded DNA-binding protein [Streptomyces lavendulae]ATZ26634.1 Single-stranded DNA-binding protein 1 [Streptomyces lavendulae subsp. lavendulae]QUQ56462.1 Single-stranded DNA-binding protein 1 [Streptomyces lavendulae subsp. lavendulae]GLV81607.1 single-stranded DNA-binding protein 1 [Streptomyces lavendulae subsp. lavendulae]GLV96957.1 single-stranded DNA-binding protein 1 [Streptomyces lavendulae subsp. lavendulae]
MNDTLVTLVGYVATQIDFKETPAGPSARFRFAVTPRYFDRRTDTWTDAATSFYTVWARRVLALNLASSVSVGEPLVVHGRLRVREDPPDGDGVRWFSADIDAVAVGHDLNRGTAAFRRVVKTDTPLMGPQKAAVV